VRLKIAHETVYQYGALVSHSIQSLRLTPRSDHRQRVLRWRLDLPACASEYVDAYGNVTRLLILEGTHRDVRIAVEGEVDVAPEESSPFPAPERVPPRVFLQETPLTAVDERLQAFVDAERTRAAADPVDALIGLMERIRAAVRYAQGTTDVETTAAEVLSNGSGVCQDHSHLFIAGCKALGIPARYVSGYYYSGHEIDHEAAMHAWAEAWVESMGWLSFDVSNGCPEGPAHVRLAVGRDYLDACPVRGVRFGGGHEMMDIRVRVAPALSHLQRQQAQPPQQAPHQRPQAQQQQ
jgi:transglutaminase-like putative cysteine protease